MNRIADLSASHKGHLNRMAQAPVYVFATKLLKNTKTIRIGPRRCGWAQGEGLEHPRRQSVVPKVAFRSVQVHPGDITIECE